MKENRGKKNDFITFFLSSSLYGGMCHVTITWLVFSPSKQMSADEVRERNNSASSDGNSTTGSCKNSANLLKDYSPDLLKIQLAVAEFLFI